MLPALPATLFPSHGNSTREGDWDAPCVLLCTHFLDEETEAQTGQAMCPKSHGESSRADLNPRLSAPGPALITTLLYCLSLYVKDNRSCIPITGHCNGTTFSRTSLGPQGSLCLDWHPDTARSALNCGQTWAPKRDAVPSPGGGGSQSCPHGCAECTAPL